MAEPFGIAAGAVGLATAFTACVDCFQYVQYGRNFARDLQTDLLTLDCAKLRLTRWGQSVNIANDPLLGRPDATSAEIQTVKDCLVQIIALFADTEKISKKYALNANAYNDPTILSSGDMDPTIVSLKNQFQALARKRQQGSNFTKRVSWTLYHKAELEELCTRVSSLIDNVEKLFPAKEIQLQLVKQELEEIQDYKVLQLVEKAARGVDDMLHTAARQANAGHQYWNVRFIGIGQAGDTFSSDWKGGAVGPSHIYNGVVVEKDGKALVGDNYGGKGFWDP